MFSCSEPPDGEAVYLTSGCTRCHELDGSGGSQGPRLEKLGDKWTPESLEAFLSDPPIFVQKDTRLQAYSRDYVTPMPKIELDPEKRRALVVFLLQKYP